MVHPLLQGLITKCERDCFAAQEFLANGGAKSFDEYKEVVGRIRGLQLATMHIKDLAKAVSEDDSDE